MDKKKWFLNGGRGSGKTFRLLCETYENKIAELKRSCDETQELLDKQIEATYRLDKENAELKHTIATLRQEKDNVSMHTKAMEVVAETRSDQLTNAKEVIKNLISAYITYADSFDDRDNELIAEAENFLKESEGK